MTSFQEAETNLERLEELLSTDDIAICPGSYLERIMLNMTSFLDIHLGRGNRHPPDRGEFLLLSGAACHTRRPRRAGTPQYGAPLGVLGMS